MPINAMIPMSGTKLTVPDEQGMAVRAQNIIASKDTMRRNKELDAQRNVSLANSEMDAEQKASLEAMARIHKVEQGWVNKYMQSGMDEQTSNQKAMETVAPYAQQEIDHHNTRYKTQYTIDDVNKARQPMQQVMSKYQQQMELEKLKGKNAINKQAAGTKAKALAKPKKTPITFIQPKIEDIDAMNLALEQYIATRPDFEGEGVPEGSARDAAGAFLALVKQGVPQQQALQQAVESVASKFKFRSGGLMNDTLNYNPLNGSTPQPPQQPIQQQQNNYSQLWGQ